MADQELQALGPVDSAFFFVDRPETPMNIGAIAIFEGKIPFQTLVRLVDAKIHQVPIYQKRIIQTPLNLGEPAWVFDPDFYIGKHVFHKVLPAPGTEEQLRQLAGRLISSQLDRSKPLWEVHLIEGLEGDRTAIFFKVHHCMVDGLSAVELITMLFDFTPEPSPLPKKPAYEPPPLPTQNDLVLGAVGRSVKHKLNIFDKIRQDVSSLGEVLADKERRRKAFMGVANLINDNLRPLHKLAISGKNTGRQSVAWVEFPLSEIRAIKANHRASVNDVMLTILGGAIQKYCHAHSEVGDADVVRVIVPVNVRTEAERGQFGNRISIITVDIRLNHTDPLERLERITEYSSVMKPSSMSLGLDLVLTLPSMAIGPLQPLIWAIAPVAFSALAHTWCTNVAGPQFPVYLAGHQMLHTYGYFPINPSMGMATVIMSYNQKISMNIMADQGIIPDAMELSRYLMESFRELKKAAKVPDIEPVVIERTRSAETPTEGEDQPEVIEVVDQRETAESAPKNIEIPTPPAASANAAAQNGGSHVTNPTEAPHELPSAPEPSAKAGSNGFHTDEPLTISPAEAHAETAEETAPQPAPAALDVAKLELFSEPWALAYRQAINGNPQYRANSLGWTAGSLAFVIKATPDFPEAAAVIMDLYKGDCRAAHSLPPQQAIREADFVIEGDHATWMRVLSGKDQPLMLLMRGKLALRKGSMIKLMPYARSAQELVRSAQNIS